VFSAPWQRGWRDLADVLDRYAYDPVMIRDVRDTAAMASPGEIRGAGGDRAVRRL